MHAFLKRQYKKGRGKMGGGARREGTDGGSHHDHDHHHRDGPAAAGGLAAGLLQYHEAVSKSMDSLLVVASSVPLPPEAQLTPEPKPRRGRRQRDQRRERSADPEACSSSAARAAQARRAAGALTSSSTTCSERRHSFDYASSKLSDDGDDDDEDDGDDCFYDYDDTNNDSDAGVVSGLVSRSLETSPVHSARQRLLLRRSQSPSGGGGGGESGGGGRGGRGGETLRTLQNLQRSFATSFMGTSASFTSNDRDFNTDSEADPGDDRSFVSVGDGGGGGGDGDGDSRVLVVTAGEEEEEDVREDGEVEVFTTHGSLPSSPFLSSGHRHQTASAAVVAHAQHALQLKKETTLRQRQNALMEHPFFVLDVRLIEGKDLVVRDSCGTSDPYVKFKVGGKQVYRSRTIFKNLSPRWDETFTIPVEDVNKPVNVKVFDKDRGLHDDPMGSTEIDVAQLELGKTSDLKLLLSDRGKSDYMGYLLLTCTLQPKTQDDKDQFLRRTVRSTETASKKLKMQSWSGVVTIVLVEGVDLVPMDDNGLSDPYVKFKFGNEKYRSKHKSKTLCPRWLEQFDLRIYGDNAANLEITVFDYDVTGKDDFMGRTNIDVSALSPEKTHTLEVELEDGAGTLKLLLTITGTCSTDATSDLANYTPDSRAQDELKKKYSAFKFAEMDDVGALRVKVFKATGLKSADLGGLSDPFCVIEVVNARVQTHTEYKTLNPEWNKVFNFQVRDIHSTVEMTVYDEDRDKKVEFLGKIAIPILKVRNGERRWYALKDKKLNRRTKGAILLEMDVIFNHVKAAVRTVNPAEEKFMQVEPKFKIHLMRKNIDRVTQLVSGLMEGGKFLQSCFAWESTPRSVTAFIVYMVMVWNFELYMLPITLLLIFLKNLIIAQIVGAFKRDQVEDEYFDDEDEDEDEDKEKEEKKSFKEKLQSIQDVCLQVQQGMDMVASLGERVKNTFNWSVPWLSTLAVVALSVGVIVLYLIPIRLLLLAWGINKFTKKLRKPNAISNNELLDFLSRVPSDSELIQYREMRPELSPTPGKKTKRS